MKIDKKIFKRKYLQYVGNNLYEKMFYRYQLKRISYEKLEKTKNNNIGEINFF